MSDGTHDTTQFHGRVQLLEHTVHNLEKRVEQGFSDLTKAIQRVGDALGTKSNPVPVKEIATTIAVCLGIVAYVGNYLETQYQKNIAPVRGQIEMLDYRIKLLESHMKIAPMQMPNSMPKL